MPPSLPSERILDLSSCRNSDVLDTLRKLPIGVAVIDAKAQYDAVHGDALQAGGFNMKEEYTALELQALVENLQKFLTTD